MYPCYWCATLPAKMQLFSNVTSTAVRQIRRFKLFIQSNQIQSTSASSGCKLPTHCRVHIKRSFFSAYALVFFGVDSWLSRFIDFPLVLVIFPRWVWSVVDFRFLVSVFSTCFVDHKNPLLNCLDCWVFNGFFPTRKNTPQILRNVGSHVRLGAHVMAVYLCWAT